MDNFWQTRTLTKAVNEMTATEMAIYSRFFKGKSRGETTSRLAWDVIWGNEYVLSNLPKEAPMPVGGRTHRKAMFCEAPRFGEKRMIHNWELENMRAYGSEMLNELLSDRIAREMTDMRNILDVTLEHLCASALHGECTDGSGTVLVDFDYASDHIVTLSANDQWDMITTGYTGNPIKQIRDWKLKIEQDSTAPITGWRALCGNSVMDAIIEHPKVIDKVVYDAGRQIAESGRFTFLAGVTIEEINTSWKDSNGVFHRFVAADKFILIGETSDLFELVYFAPFDGLPGGVGMGGMPPLFRSTSWLEQDPAGRWIKVETRPLPIIRRPSHIMVCDVC